MKTQQEIEKMREDIQKEIDDLGEKSRTQIFGSGMWDMYDRQYSKKVAQYNILLEVLK
jgi:hypothetical protein